jgi:adenylate cyclase class 2
LQHDGVETEIKLRASSPVEARAAVVALGAQVRRPRHFEDNLLLDDTRHRLRAAGCILRLRRTPEGGWLTYKGPRQEGGEVKARPEIEVFVARADADTLEALLAAVGFRRVFRYQKYREAWSWKDVEIVVDETPVGTFFEIEGPVAGIHEAAAALGYQRSDYLTESYVGLFFAAGGQGDMVFE